MATNGKSCANCSKLIIGEPKIIKGITSNQSFHQTPEECAEAKSVIIIRKSWGIHGRTSRATGA